MKVDSYDSYDTYDSYDIYDSYVPGDGSSLLHSTVVFHGCCVQRFLPKIEVLVHKQLDIVRTEQLTKLPSPQIVVLSFRNKM